MSNPFDGVSSQAALKAFLNSRCPHGYTHRKNCSRCQSQAGSTPWRKSGDDDRRPRRSVFERYYRDA